MKIFITYATAGAGHKKAAEAVYLRLKSDPAHQIVFADSLDYTTAWFKKTYSGTYTWMITQAPWLWGFFFSLSNIPFVLPVFQFLRRIYNMINAGGLARYLQEERFDVVITTHFLANEVAACLKRAGQIQSKLICVVTDFDVHPIWLANGVDTYTVASDWTKKKLVTLGVPEERIAVTGIPTIEKFSKIREVRQVRKQLGLRETAFTVLVATGSFGIGPIEEIINALTDVQVLVISGHNKNLYNRLGPKHPLGGLVRIYGLVNNMDEMMAASDVMITKPGGLSISEALVTGLPLIFFNAIPGQEENNVKVLKGHGIGVNGTSIAVIAAALQELKTSPEKLQAAKTRTQVLAKPNAVFDIVKLLL